MNVLYVQVKSMKLILKNMISFISVRGRCPIDMDKEYAATYIGGSCLNKYWIYNEKHKCIAYNSIMSEITDKDGVLKEEFRSPKIKQGE